MEEAAKYSELAVTAWRDALAFGLVAAIIAAVVGLLHLAIVLTWRAPCCSNNWFIVSLAFAQQTEPEIGDSVIIACLVIAAEPAEVEAAGLTTVELQAAELA